MTPTSQKDEHSLESIKCICFNYYSFKHNCVDIRKQLCEARERLRISEGVGREEINKGLVCFEESSKDRTECGAGLGQERAEEGGGHLRHFQQ